MVYPYLGFDRYVDIGALLGEDLVAGIRPTKISANIIRRFGRNSRRKTFSCAAMSVMNLITAA